jgi:hypothetical protein
MGNLTGILSILLKWKAFNMSLELEMEKVNTSETGFIKVEKLISPSCLRRFFRSEETALVQLLSVLHRM